MNQVRQAVVAILNRVPTPSNTACPAALVLQAFEPLPPLKRCCDPRLR